METKVHRKEEHGLISWRCDQLVQAGFELAVAVNLAHDPGYDLHSLVELVERGCPPDVAVRIVAPLS